MFSVVSDFLTRRRGNGRADPMDVVTYAYLILGTIIMFGPVLWLVLSSFKTPAGLAEFPPRFMPVTPVQIEVEGFSRPMTLFDVAMEDGSVRRLAQVRQVGLEAQLIDPADPETLIKVHIDQRTQVREVKFAWRNYVDPLGRFNFLRYFGNSFFVTTVATIITLIINSMAAFALSKYEFRGRTPIFVFIIATLMIPLSLVLVPVFLIVTTVGLTNSLWGVIIPTVATPTGVFLLRQYMLTIPDELLDAARMDNASEWRIYWRIIMPLSLPALAVLAIFSIMWRWNDFLWPLIVLTKSENFTLQVGLAAFQGEFDVQWHFVLAMTVLTLLPITFVFAFLQRFITTGIANTGLK